MLIDHYNGSNIDLVDLVDKFEIRTGQYTTYYLLRI